MIKNKTVTGQSSPGMGFWAGLPPARSHRAHRRTSIILKNLNAFTIVDITSCHKHGAYDNSHLPPYAPEGQNLKWIQGLRSGCCWAGLPLQVLRKEALCWLFQLLVDCSARIPSLCLQSSSLRSLLPRRHHLLQGPGIQRLWRFRVVLSIYQEMEWVRSLKPHHEGIRGSSPLTTMTASSSQAPGRQDDSSSWELQ